ncbi:MAG TPA: hypothetical protein VGM54_13735 [Chthoniobacter sp.]
MALDLCQGSTGQIKTTDLASRSHLLLRESFGPAQFPKNRADDVKDCRHAPGRSVTLMKIRIDDARLKEHSRRIFFTMKTLLHRLVVLVPCALLFHASAQTPSPVTSRRIDGIVIKQISERAVLVNDDTFGLIVVRGIHPNVGATVKLTGTLFDTVQMPWHGSAVWVQIVDAK